MLRSVHLHIHGLVQGVWYRDSARKKAIELGLHGFVRNEEDGSVYAEVEGDAGATDAFIEWCRSGPPAATVERVDVTDVDPAGHSGFEIHR